MAFDQGFVVSLGTSTLTLATPMVFAGVGGVISERSGVLNIALEGMLLAGAFGYFIGGYWTNNIWMAMLVAAVFALILAILLAVLSIAFRVDQVVGGMALNLIAIGGTGFLYRSAFGLSSNPVVPVMNGISIPGLTSIPVIGPILFGEAPLTYVALALVVAAALLLRKMRLGLWVRATGERPEASKAAGINVFTIRYAAVGVSGFLCGLGGAFLLSQIGSFTEDMTAGIGFIALAAIIFGNWEPGRTLIACLLFAFVQSLQTSLQVAGINIPYQLLLMAPYIVTIIVLAGFIGRSRAPAADGQPYVRS